MREITLVVTDSCWNTFMWLWFSCTSIN